MNKHPSINHLDESEGETDTEQLRKFVAENIKLEQFYKLAEGNASEQEMIREIYDTICDVVCFPRKQITTKKQVPRHFLTETKKYDILVLKKRIL